MDGNLYLKDMTGAAIGTAANPLVVYATGSTGVSSLSALTDVLIVTPASGQSLLYSATDSKWHNGSIAGSGDMMKSAYATVSESTVDNSFALNGHADTYFATAAHNHNIWDLTGYATLNADTLDGEHAAAFATALHTHAHNDTTSLQGGQTDQYYHLNATSYASVIAWAVGGGAHNTLTGLQGGTTNEYYHLTSTQNASVSAWDVATAAHNHTGTYLPIAGKAADSDLLDGTDSTGFARYQSVTTTVGTSNAGWYRIAESSTYLVLRNPFTIAWGSTGVSHGNVTITPQQSFEQDVILTQTAFSVWHNTGYGITKARLVYSSTGADKSYLEIYSDGIANYDLFISQIVYWNNWTIYANPEAGGVPGGYSSTELTFAGAINSTGSLYSAGTQVAVTTATHNSWSSPQGGSANQYYHLDATSYASVAAWNVAAAASRLTAVSTSFSFATTSNDDGLLQQTVNLGANFGQIVRVRVWADQTMGQRTAGTVLINNASGIDPSTTSMAYDGLVGTLPTAGAEGVGDYVWIDNELCRVSAGTSTPLTIVRGLCGSMGAFHDDNAVVTTANDGLRIALFQTATSYPAEAILDMRKVMTGKFTTDAAINAGDKVFTLSSSPAVLADWGYDDLGLIDDTSDEYFRVQKTYGAVAGTTYDDSIAVLNPLAAHDTSKTVYRVVEYTTPIPFKFSGSATTLYLDIYAHQLLPGATTVYLEFLIDKWS